MKTKHTTILLLLIALLLSACATQPKVRRIHVPANQQWFVRGYEKRWDGKEALRINVGTTGPVDITIWPAE